MRSLGVLWIFLFIINALAAPDVEIPIQPNDSVTPGQLCSPSDPDFQSYRYANGKPYAYCRRNVKSGRKRQIYDLYNIPAKCKSSYTVDHLIPLSMGGSNSVRNLWPEHHRVKDTRETLESETFDQVGGGGIDVEEAIDIILEAKRELVLDLSSVDGCG